jgi:two-component system, NarL family, response regulator LiaR
MSENARIRVAIVDNNDLVRSGYDLFVSSFDDLEVVGTASDGSEALRLCAETHPDVVLMDLLMPGMNGAEATRAIKLAFPRVRVIILSGFDQGELIEQAMANGAVNRMSKSISLDDMAEMIRAANAITDDAIG